MLIALLLVAALVCLAVGLVLASATWLALSLAASLSAGLLLYLRRSRMARGASVPRGPESARAATAPARRADVWIIEGRPRYHRADCEFLAGREAEPLPWAQAIENGFVACSLCQPDRAEADV